MGREFQFSLEGEGELLQCRSKEKVCCPSLGGRWGKSSYIMPPPPFSFHIYTRFPPIPSHGVGARSADIAAKLNKSRGGKRVEERDSAEMLTKHKQPLKSSYL